MPARSFTISADYKREGKKTALIITGTKAKAEKFVHTLLALSDWSEISINDGKRDYTPEEFFHAPD